MSVESQKLLEILQYICFAGLILPGLAAFILPDPRKKAVSLFIMFISITILSFVFYAGILLFIVNIVFVFVFIILYMIARRTAGPDDEARTATGKRSIAVKAGGFVAAILFCSWLGYIIFDIYQGDIFPGAKKSRRYISPGWKKYQHPYSGHMV